MADDRFDFKKAIADNSKVSDLSNLASSGIRRVKVLDENGLLELIDRAVNQVVTTQTQEERSRILADSRKQLTKLMNERDQFTSRAEMLEAGRNELIQQIEKLQQELKLRRDVGDVEAAAQKKSQELLAENGYLRDQHDKMVEELDQAQTEIRTLKEEIERLRAEIERLLANAQSGDDNLQRELESARAEAAELRERLSGGDTLAQELATACQENDELKQQLQEIREAGETAAGAIRHQLERAREDAAKFERQAREAREAQENVVIQHVEIERGLHEEIEKLKQEQAQAAAAPPVEVIEEVPIIEEPPPPALPPGLKPGKGLDVGTVNLVCAAQNEKGETDLKLQRNVFLDVEITPYTKAMLTKLNVGYVVQGKRMYILGEPAFQLANVLNRRTRRPMKDGLISPKEQDALPIMKLLIGSILGEPRVPGEVCFYSVPGDPVDSDLSVAYHRDLFDAVLKSLGFKPSHILEGHAVTFAELADEDFTGIGVSCGGGMFNVCVAYKSMPALAFSSSRSGDWVDLNVAQVLGIKPEKAAMLKEQGVDLMAPKNREEDAIAIYYRNLIQYNITNIAERFRSADNMPTFNDPISVVFSGGTSMAGNFIELVRDVFKKIDFPIPVKEVRMAKDPLNATAKGALVAAQLEMANNPQ
jgi:signal transduction histidine kinase